MLLAILFLVLIKGDNRFNVRRQCGSAAKDIFFIIVSVMRALFFSHAILCLFQEALHILSPACT